MNLKKINFKSPQFQRAGLIFLLGIAGIGLWSQTIYKEQESSLRTLVEKRNNKQNELNNILAMKPKLAKLQQEVDIEKMSLDSLKSIFPDQKEIPKLLREITTMARMAGIINTKFNPLPDVEKEYYIENKYNMTVLGGFHEVAQFFSDLSNMSLIINLAKVNLKFNERIEQAINDNRINGSPIYTVSVNFELTTFSSKK